MGAQNHKQDSVLIEEFARLYYAEVDPEELAARAPLDLKGAAAAHLAFGRKFTAGQARLRAYNPVSGQHGWQSTHTAIEIVSDDMPFLVDSVTMEVNRQGLTLHLLIHPVLRALRDAKGELLSISQPNESSEGRLESFMHIEVDRQTDPARLAELEAGIARVLADVRAAVEDWKPMQARMAEIVKRLSADRYDEERAFLAWLLEDHFTFLGCRGYELSTVNGEDVLRIVPGSGLGILRERGETVSASFATLPPEARKRARVKELLVLTKANARSTVHRPGQLDYVGIKRFNDKSEVIGETRFLGLYTHTAYSENPMRVPLLRRKLGEVIERAGLLPAGYSGKARAAKLFRVYGHAFPAGYRDEYPVDSAVTDIEMIESLAPQPDLGMNLYAPQSEPGILHFKIYRRGSRVPLSDSLPMLERLGVRVFFEHPHKVEPAGSPPVRVVDFGLALPSGALPLEQVREHFHEAFLGMFLGTVEADSLNRLVLTAGLGSREISVLRAYARYLRQGTSTFSLAYVEQALVANARIAALLVRLFFTRF